MFHLHFKNNVLAATLLMGALCCPDPVAAQRQKGKPMAPTKTWQGIIRDETPKKAAPANNIVASSQDWEKLWKAWRGEERLPAIDFKSNIAVVIVYGAPNYCSMSALLEENGNLRVINKHTLLEGAGFGYQVGVFPRAGIRTVDGKKVPPFVP